MKGSPLDSLITSQVVPVTPDEISIGTIRIRAGMTALCRTGSSVLVENHPCVPVGATLPVTEIAPDLIKAFSGHEEPFGVFKEGNIPHHVGIDKIILKGFARKAKFETNFETSTSIYPTKQDQR